MQHYDPLQVYSSWQTRVWNAYQRWGVAVAEPKDPLVFVVQIDNQSIKFVEEKYGEGWPWSRQRYADLLKILFEDYKVGVVGVDIAMPYSRDTQGNDALLALSQQYPLVLPQAFDFSSPKNALVTGKISAGIAPDEATATAVLPEANGYAGLNNQLVADQVYWACYADKRSGVGDGDASAAAHSVCWAALPDLGAGDVALPARRWEICCIDNT